MSSFFYSIICLLKVSDRLHINIIGWLTLLNLVFEFSLIQCASIKNTISIGWSRDYVPWLEATLCRYVELKEETTQIE